MIYAITKNYIHYTGDTYTYLSCALHTFTPLEALYFEDELNTTDNDPGIYYETLTSDTIDKCDFCNVELAVLLWSE